MFAANGQEEEERQSGGKEDLVVCENTQRGIDNRWVSGGDVIDYTQVEFFDPIRWQANNSHLRRLKVYQLPARLIELLLTNLNEQNTLTQLGKFC